MEIPPVIDDFPIKAMIYKSKQLHHWSTYVFFALTQPSDTVLATHEKQALDHSSPLFRRSLVGLVDLLSLMDHLLKWKFPHAAEAISPSSEAMEQHNCKRNHRTSESEHPFKMDVNSHELWIIATSCELPCGYQVNQPQGSNHSFTTMAGHQAATLVVVGSPPGSPTRQVIVGSLANGW